MTNKELKELERMFGTKCEENPAKGFFTRRQLQKMWNCGESSISKRINLCLRNNLLEMKMYRVKSGMVTRPIPHYRIIKK